VQYLLGFSLYWSLVDDWHYCKWIASSATAAAYEAGAGGAPTSNADDGAAVADEPQVVKAKAELAKLVDRLAAACDLRSDWQPTDF
jgi:hypothetical protein